MVTQISAEEELQTTSHTLLDFVNGEAVKQLTAIEQNIFQAIQELERLEHNEKNLQRIQKLKEAHALILRERKQLGVLGLKVFGLLTERPSEETTQEAA